jgi:hypothetical protein
MKLSEVQVGGRYLAKVSGVLTTVRVLAVRQTTTFKGRACSLIDVVNERTGRRTTFRSPARLRRRAEPSRGTGHRLKTGPDGEPAIDQGLVHGLPCTFNPDDGRFYVHAPGTTDGTNVLGTFKDWRNAVQFARRSAGEGA